MTCLFSLLVIASVTAYSQAQNGELSTYVTERNLGNINPVTELKVLNAFVRANPRLPEELRDTRVKTRLIHVTALYQDHKHAIIDVRCGSNYHGFVEVYFNGGPAPTTPSSPVSYGRKINLSSLTNLNRNLNLNKGAIRITDDDEGRANILDAFFSKNTHLRTGLRSVLKVGRITGRSACLYVPQPNFDYEGNVNVSF